MSPRGTPASASSRRRWASKRASATHAGLVSDGGGSSSIPSAFQPVGWPDRSLRGVGEQELGRRPGPAVPTAPPGSSGRSSLVPRPALSAREVAKQCRAGKVDGGQDLRPGAEVPPQRPLLGPLILPGLAPAPPEHLQVGVPEAVDGLELVADHEQPRLGAAQRVDQPQLDAVRVLELVHHQVLEALTPRRSAPAPAIAAGRAHAARGPRSPPRSAPP